MPETTEEPKKTPRGPAAAETTDGTTSARGRVAAAGSGQDEAKPAGSGALDAEKGEGKPHDILFIDDDGEYYKFPANRPPEGKPPTLPIYDQPPTRPTFEEAGSRRVMNLAQPGGMDTGRDRGPALATIPVTPEPKAASAITCYVINARNLSYANPYTAEEWAASGVPDYPAHEVGDSFELLVAGPNGNIYLLSGEGENAQCKLVPRSQMKLETEVWSQLRNGTVVGRVLFEQRVVPLVNVTSLMPKREAEERGR